MKSAAEVIRGHEIKGPDSCVSWVVEFILKLYDEIGLNEYPLQSEFPQGIGFGEVAKQRLREYNIGACDTLYEWTDFERQSKEDARLGVPLVFVIPLSAVLNFETSAFDGFHLNHAAIAVHDPKIAYVTRSHNKPHLSPIDLLRYYTFLRTTIKSDYKLHCLRHRPKRWPVESKAL